MYRRQITTMFLAVFFFVPWAAATADETFPDCLVKVTPHPENPIFAGTGKDTWDKKIRERGYILREGDRWHLWYTGYGPARPNTMSLGYATSSDGLQWTRHPKNPIFDDLWTEDMFVVKHEGTYYMVAEGKNDVAHMLTSSNGIDWQSRGRLDVRTTDGKPLSPGPYGTPTLWIEGDDWYLFYERGDRGVWLARSRDRQVWTNVQDDPVIARGPEAYDKHAVAMNQVIRHDGRYYAVYHANADPKWKGPWTTCIAASDDLVHWKKYPGNPVLRDNFSSGQFVHDGERYRLYTMHPDVRVFLPAK
jgi:sucrose-6-phosphate hydrolase SacC (GH32 family)